MIRNSNAHFVRAALTRIGAREVHYGEIVTDDPERIRERIREGLADDFLILSGGVSEGEMDVVPQCLAECGVEKILHKVAVKPGKPLYVGKSPSGTVVFGLPGNPVAVMVHMAMLVRPLFLKASGAREYLPKPIYLPLAAEASNRSIGKKFTPARVVSKGGKASWRRSLQRLRGFHLRPAGRRGLRDPRRRLPASPREISWDSIPCGGTSSRMKDEIAAPSYGSTGEISGSLGDLGTFLPLTLGYITRCGLSPAPVFFFAGLWNVATGLMFRLPIPVQPMKAIAAAAIAEG